MKTGSYRAARTFIASRKNSMILSFHPDLLNRDLFHLELFRISWISLVHPVFAEVVYTASSSVSIKDQVQLCLR